MKQPLTSYKNDGRLFLFLAALAKTRTSYCINDAHSFNSGFHIMHTDDISSFQNRVENKVSVIRLNAKEK